MDNGAFVAFDVELGRTDRTIQVFGGALQYGDTVCKA